MICKICGQNAIDGIDLCDDCYTILDVAFMEALTDLNRQAWYYNKGFDMDDYINILGDYVDKKSDDYTKEVEAWRRSRALEKEKRARERKEK